jgi:anti-sigma factor RsiW
MDCNEARITMVDDVRGRLSSEERARLREHVAGCEACAHELRAEEALTDALANRLPSYKAPPSLLRRARKGSAARRDRARLGLLPALAVAAALALSLSGWLVYKHTLAGDGDALTREAINDHLRITFAEHPIEVASGGIHQVKPWFAGKVDFAPVIGFSGDGDFPLVGGSVAYFIDRKAAAFVFQRRLHKISLFVFPTDGLPWPRSGARDVGNVKALARSERGFNVLFWQANGLGYALVSDVDAAELGALAERVSGKN